MPSITQHLRDQYPGPLNPLQARRRQPRMILLNSSVQQLLGPLTLQLLSHLLSYTDSRGRHHFPDFRRN